MVINMSEFYNMTVAIDDMAKATNRIASTMGKVLLTLQEIYICELRKADFLTMRKNFIKRCGEINDY